MNQNKFQLQNKQGALVFFGIVLLSLTLACSLGDIVQVSFGNPTPTRTRTPRPTFTPRVELTSTPEDTPTPLATDTPDVTATATRRPTSGSVAVRTATKPPAPPPPPQYRFKQSASGNQGRCDGGPGVFEVKGRVRGSGGYIGGIHVVLLDKSGAMVGQADSIPPEYLNPEFGVSCFEDKNIFNYKIDFSAARNNGPWLLRLTKSASDLSPISPNITIANDPSGGRWYIDFTE